MHTPRPLYLETLFSQSYFWRCLAKSLCLHGFYEVNVVAPKMPMNATLVLNFISGLPGGAKKVKGSFKNLALAKSQTRLSDFHFYLMLFSCYVMSDSFVTPWTVARQAPLPWTLQVSILEWVTISCSRGSSQPRDQTPGTYSTVCTCIISLCCTL